MQKENICLRIENPKEREETKRPRKKKMTKIPRAWKETNYPKERKNTQPTAKAASKCTQKIGSTRTTTENETFSLLEEQSTEDPKRSSIKLKLKGKLWWETPQTTEPSSKNSKTSWILETWSLRIESAAIELEFQREFLLPLDIGWFPINAQDFWSLSPDTLPKSKHLSSTPGQQLWILICFLKAAISEFNSQEWKKQGQNMLCPSQTNFINLILRFPTLTFILCEAPR